MESHMADRRELNIHYLPQFVAESDLAGSTVVVVDLLRASTTICHALEAGAISVRPFLTIDETVAAAAEYERSQVVLGGERGGRRIEGFDLGNSPPTYTPNIVFGRHVLFTTTNGTKALHHARLAERVLIGAAVNRRAVAEAVSTAPRVDILCAGTGGQKTREDVLAAGAIAQALMANRPWQSNEWADAALGEWEELTTTARALGRTASEQLAQELRHTPGGKNLLAIGQDDDLPLCAQLDTLAVVPEWDRETGQIRLV